VFAMATFLLTALPAFAFAFRVGGLLLAKVDRLPCEDAVDPFAFALRFFFPLSFLFGGMISNATN